MPLRAVKGQTLRMHDPSGPGLLTRVLRMSPGYVVPRGEAVAWLRDAGGDLRRVLHGEQQFDYQEMAYAGDTLSISSHVEDIYAKRNLEFVVRATSISRDGTKLASMRQVLILRYPEATS